MKPPIIPIDVLIPVRGELEKLRWCCKAIRRFVPVNHLIICTANTSKKATNEIEKLADIPIFDNSLKGAGATRALGLKAVETEFYGSIDADVIIGEKWYRWCNETIQNPRVAACQGYQKPVGKLCSKWYESMMLDRGHCDQGNTLLRTRVIKQVGMPIEIQSEDATLRTRLTNLGYEWIVNKSLFSTHLQTDREFFAHWFFYGKLEAFDWIHFCKYVIWLSRWSMQQREFNSRQMALLNFLVHLTRAAGSVAGEYSSSS